MTKKGGVYELPCLVNGVKMNFILDTGASKVSISGTEVLFLYKNGYLKDSDFLGESYSIIADGNVIENDEILLRSIQIAGIEIRDVKATVINNLSAPLLLGQSALEKFSKVEISGDRLYLTAKSESGSVNRVTVSSANASRQDSEKKQSIKQPAKHLSKSKEERINELLVKAVEATKAEFPKAGLIGSYCDEIRILIEGKKRSPAVRDWKSYAIMGMYYFERKPYGDKSYKFAIEPLRSYKVNNERKQTLKVGDTEYLWENVVSALAYSLAITNNEYSNSPYMEAIQTAKEVLESYPKNKRSIKAAAIAYTRMKDYSKAEEWAKKMLAIDNHDGLFLLAGVYFTQGRTSLAAEHYQTLLKKYPDDDTALYNLALCYSKHFEESFYNDGTYYAPIGNSYFERTVSLMKKAARFNNENAQEWLKKRHYDW